MMLRFVTIGILATLVHMAAALGLIVISKCPIMAANVTAFLLAVSVSFTGNYFWTFQARGSFRKSLRRYLLIAACAFLANNLVLAGLLAAHRIGAMKAIVISAAVVPFCTYVLSRLWAFRDSTGRPRPNWSA
jgi:putative flippase GtrA